MGTLLAAGLLGAWVLGACGSGGAGTVAQQAQQAASSAATQVASAVTPKSQDSSSTTSGQSTATRTATQTSTVTETRTSSRTETKTESVPGQTASITNQTTKLQLAPTTSTTGTQSGGGGLPWWAWVLIGAGVVGTAFVLFAAGRRRGARTSGEQDVRDRDSGTSPGPTEPRSS